MIEEIREHVKEQSKKPANIFGMLAFDVHFVGVVKYAKILAEKRNADMQVVEIAAWLHDIGSVIGEYENHHIVGAEYAENYLKKFNLPQEKIKKIKHCIYAHRASKNIPRQTVEAEIISDADAMSHFDSINDLFRLSIETHKYGYQDSINFVLGKLERSWQKLTPHGKEVIEPKYKAIKIIFN